jgi:hypothetical protein
VPPVAAVLGTAALGTDEWIVVVVASVMPALAGALAILGAARG